MKGYETRNMKKVFFMLFVGQITSFLLFILMTVSSAEAVELDWPSLLEMGTRCSGLAEELILSVIWQESKGNPNAVNVNGVGGFFPKTRAQAMRIIYKYNRASTDIGLMQVNWKTWGPYYGLKAVDLLDPATNVCVGARILRDYVDEHKGSWRGVGRYNAVSYDKQRTYASAVGRIYKRIRSVYKRRDTEPETKEIAKAETVSQWDLITGQTQSQ
jgi:soluble lytic murein transglycosylase-like protein